MGVVHLQMIERCTIAILVQDHRVLLVRTPLAQAPPKALKMKVSPGRGDCARPVTTRGARSTNLLQTPDPSFETKTVSWHTGKHKCSTRALQDS